MLSAPAQAAFVVGEHDRSSRRAARVEHACVQRLLDRRAIRIAHRAQHTAHGRGHQLAAAVRSVGPLTAERGDRRVDEPRIERSERLGFEAARAQVARLGGLHQHVGALAQPTQAPDALALFEIERHALLAQLVEQLLRFTRTLRACLRHDLDHPRAQAAEKARAGGAEGPFELDDAKPFQHRRTPGAAVIGTPPSAHPTQTRCAGRPRARSQRRSRGARGRERPGRGARAPRSEG